MTIWFISDTHFGHTNMLTFRQDNGELVRPGFSSAAEMDEVMVERWNAVVRPSDKIYHMGDVAMRKQDLPIVKRLHGHKRLIRGNHDIYRTKDYLAVGFEEILGMRVMNNILFTHVPVHPDSIKFRWFGNAHGHIHERPSPPGKYVNLSVEQINYTPVTLEQVEQLLKVRA